MSGRVELYPLCTGFYALGCLQQGQQSPEPGGRDSSPYLLLLQDLHVVREQLACVADVHCSLCNMQVPTVNTTTWCCPPRRRDSPQPLGPTALGGQQLLGALLQLCAITQMASPASVSPWVT